MSLDGEPCQSLYWRSWFRRRKLPAGRDSLSTFGCGADPRGALCGALPGFGAHIRKRLGKTVQARLRAESPDSVCRICARLSRVRSHTIHSFRYSQWRRSAKPGLGPRGGPGAASPHQPPAPRVTTTKPVRLLRPRYETNWGLAMTAPGFSPQSRSAQPGLYSVPKSFSDVSAKAWHSAL